MSTYGERLKEAMAYRSAQIGREVTRIELANAAGCSRQNIGMILTGAQGEDQKLSTERHAKAAAYLKVDADWLLEGKGSMELKSNMASELSELALGLGALLDKIPRTDPIKRARAHAAAWEAIRKELPPEDANHPAQPGY